MPGRTTTPTTSVPGAQPPPQRATTPRTAITTWNWRYLVSHHPRTDQHVQNAINTLPDGPHRQQQQALLDYHRRITSLDAILDHPPTTTNLKRIDPETLLHVPAELERCFLARIEQHPIAGQRTHLLALLRHARRVPFVNHNRAIFTLIFGDQLDALLRDARYDRADLHPPESGSVGIGVDLATFARSYHHDLQSDSRINPQLAPHAPLRYDIEISHGSGYGEYWPRELTRHKRDRLILHSNPDARRLHNFLTTLRHEIYPGHGYYYERLRNAHATYIDHGALTLTEGWATWAEWGLTPDTYGRHTRANRIKTLELFDDTSPTTPQRIAHATRDAGLTPRAAHNAQRDHYQYPGLSYAYVLGALWIEHQLHHTPLHAILRRQHWSDQPLERSENTPASKLANPASPPQPRRQLKGPP